MNKYCKIFLLFTASFLCLTIAAQVSAPKDVYKAIVRIATYNADGSALRTGTGVFINEQGTCAASYALFRGAARAEVIDFKGNVLPVSRILGASSNYDLVKFSVTGSKKPAYLAIATSAPLVGTSLTFQDYSTDKKVSGTAVIVTQAEDYDKYKYFHISWQKTARAGLPLMTSDCALAAFAQQSANAADSCTYAIDARFLNTLKIAATSALNADLRAIAIPKAIPENEQDALTYLYTISADDSLASISAIDDFINAHPDNAEGYVCRANFYAAKGLYDRSEADFSTALQKGDAEVSTMKSDAVHSEWSKAIFQKAVYKPEPALPNWTLRRAYEEAQAAYAAKPQPFYLLQQGRCLFAEKKYDDAYQKFLQLAQTGGNGDESNWSGIAQAESWFYAARALELAGGDSLQVLALMDSVVAKCPHPFTQTTAQYLLERASRLQRAGQYRKAVLDYNSYEQSIGTMNLSSQFFYIREQAELACKMYQQALDDIRTAIARTPQEPAYRIEEAIVLLRAGLFKEAVSLCTQLIQNYYPNSSDCYKLLGIAHGELGQKQQAQAALSKAKALGDTTADTYIERYK